MHEISLLENVREILEQEAVKQGFSKVNKVTLEIGALSCIEPDALRFGFDVVMQDSIASAAELSIEILTAIGQCQHCHQQMQMQSLQQLCQFCGKYGVSLLQGNSMKIKDLLVY